MIVSSPEIKQLILGWYRQISSGEMVAAADNILAESPGFLALGPGEGEWFGDRTELIDAYRQTAKLGAPEIDVLQIEAYREGSVGWAVDTVMFKRPGQNKLCMRHTFVLHQESGEWKVIHAHYSFPVLDDVLVVEKEEDVVMKEKKRGANQA